MTLPWSDRSAVAPPTASGTVSAASSGRTGPGQALVLALIAALERLQPVAQLAARWTVAQVFFLSGLTKLRDWDTTLALFADEYQVPLLSPPVAAVLGTGGELVLPVLLLLGLGGRLAALGLSIVNGVAVISLTDIPEPALQLHIFWGSLLLGLLLWGPGRWSVDALLARQGRGLRA